MTELPLLRDAVIGRLRAAGCVFAEDEADLLLATAEDPPQLDDLVDRRVAGQPLETILGWVCFAGRRVVVGPGVFVPRQRTAALVDQAERRTPAGSVVLDLACGSAAIAGVLLDRIGPLEVHAVDIDPVAVACARRNLPPPATVYTGDLFAPLPLGLLGRVDTVVANVPYVPTAQIDRLPPEARAHEPHRTLDGGPDGLSMVRRVAGEVARWLAPGGHVLVETATAQADAARRAFRSAGMAVEVVNDAELGAVVIGRRRRAPTHRGGSGTVG